jgi:hypothetical protein
MTGKETNHRKKSKATSQQLCIWQAFLTSFLQGKNFKTILIAVGKV